MFNAEIPKDVELPSSKKLIKSTVIAAVSAIVVLVTWVMPAEYAIDPTGVGKVLGLTKMG
ncbi:transmembrane anchor protein, partial [Acinetobacter junii]